MCFTSSAQNIPMWAHYGAQHSGYCLEFELDLNQIKNTQNIPIPNFDESGILSFKDQSDAHFIFTKVLYQDDMPTLLEKELRILRNAIEIEENGARYSLYKHIAHHSFGVKYKDWQYEDEYRLVVNTNSKKSGYLDISQLLLSDQPFLKMTGIILGQKFGTNLQSDLKSHLMMQHLNGYPFRKDCINCQLREWLFTFAQEKKISLSQARREKAAYDMSITALQGPSFCHTCQPADIENIPQAHKTSHITKQCTEQEIEN